MTLFECYPDESFLRFLGLTDKELSGGHSFGRSRVCGRLSKSKDSIGLIDEDPGKTMDPYSSKLLNIPPYYKDDFVVCIKEVKTGNKLIVLRPDIEVFSIRVAKSQHVNLDSYGLSMRNSELKDLLTPRKNMNKREKFMEFLNDVSKHKSIAIVAQFLKT